MAEAFLTFHLNNTQSLELTEMSAYDPITGTNSFLDAAANVLATIRTKADGAAVAGLASLVMIHRSGSDGEYYYVFDGTELTTEGIAYEVVAHGDDGFGSVFSFVLPLKVRERRSGEAA